MLTQTYKNILVGVDGSDQANLAYHQAIEVAKRNNGRVIVAHIIENKVYTMMGYSSLNDGLLDQETENAKELLDDCKDYAKSVDFTQVETIVAYGSAKEVMCQELSKKYDVDLIMVGQSGLNAVERLMIGSVSSYIIRHAPCDVLIVHPEANNK
ncbi:universal stress protein [Enterococcus caccae]|uniref:Universal stress protein n=1 Tax=Enterococcus caccae ATCC BAA-1240 TaxID=1158612 RepID=R3WRS7_9ENTE|nr:universal stress protein [Enterococcus caccae]EOL44515.1 universal stress protein [Enterococcus caccae ATCC BAA-1240]EOT58658.1 universal stress protein [Enterococcus caccae ATCC BAA-1240]OJG23373.1 universal stress protein [Enterococcus caccae]